MTTKAEEITTLANDIAVAAAEVAKMQTIHTEKAKEASYASAAECTARNNLNNAQKAFDGLVTKMRAISSRDTDWNRITHSRAVVE